MLRPLGQAERRQLLRFILGLAQRTSKVEKSLAEEQERKESKMCHMKEKSRD